MDGRAKRGITMAKPLQLHMKIVIDYLDCGLNRVAIKYKTNDTVEGVKQGLLALACNIEDLVAGKSPDDLCN
jgi:hypothetical protein